MELIETGERVEGQATIIELWMRHNSSTWSSSKLCCGGGGEDWSIGGLFEVEIGGHITNKLSMRHHTSSSKLSDCDRWMRNPNTHQTANLILTSIFNAHYILCVYVHKDWRRMTKIYCTKQGGGVNLEIWPSTTISGPAALQTPFPPSLQPPSKTWVREYIFYKQDEPEILSWLVRLNPQF